MSQPVAEFLSGSGRWAAQQPASPRCGVAQAFGIRSPELLPHTPSLAYATLEVREHPELALRIRLHASAAPAACCCVPNTQAVARCLPVCRAPLRMQSQFGDVLEQLVGLHLHRVFICDAERRPAGVLSATDLLRRICGEEP